MKRHTFADWWADNKFRLTMEYLRDYPLTFLRELWYYLRCRFWRQYNVVRVQTLPPTWTDRSYAFIHIMFQVFCDVMDKEDWFNDRAYFYPPDWDFRDEWQEAAILYDWWKNRRPARLAAEEKSLHDWHALAHPPGHDPFGPVQSVNGVGVRSFSLVHSPEEHALFDAHTALEAAGDQEDEDMMIRLVRMVPYLWT